MVFIQPDGFVDAATPIIANTSTPRNFDLSSFIEATALGEPIAATFFLTGNDAQPQHTTAGAQSGFEAAGIVPDVLPSFDPVAILDLSYPNINGSNFLVRMNENMSVPCTLTFKYFIYGVLSPMLQRSYRRLRFFLALMILLSPTRRSY
jgi:hypothetical protein